MIASVSFSQEKAQKNDKKSKDQTEKVEKRSDIVFDKLVNDFGTMEKGGDASCVFTFKNLSKKPLTLTNVKTSCGCTAAEWPREPIAKKKKGSIKVKYDSNRVGKFTKTIRVFIEGRENPIQLEIRGTIVAPNANAVPIEQQKAVKSASEPEKANVAKQAPAQKNVAQPAQKKTVETQK